MKVIKLFLIFIFLTAIELPAFSQGGSKNDEFSQALDAIFYVNYGIDDEQKPKYSAFYFDDFDTYILKASKVQSEENFLNEIITESSTYSELSYISEYKFEGFDFEKLKTLIKEKNEKDIISFIYYDYQKNLTILKFFRFVK